MAGGQSVVGDGQSGNGEKASVCGLRIRSARGGNEVDGSRLRARVKRARHSRTVVPSAEVAFKGGWWGRFDDGPTRVRHDCADDVFARLGDQLEVPLNALLTRFAVL